MKKVITKKELLEVLQMVNDDAKILIDISNGEELSPEESVSEIEDILMNETELILVPKGVFS